MTRFIAACVQVNSRDVMSDNLARAATYARDAHAAGARLIAFPENVSMMSFGGENVRAAAFPQEEHPGLGFFADLARERSDDPVSGSDGGNLGWVSPGQMVPAFEEAMNQAQVGEYFGPFRSQFGWHILQVEERRRQDVTEQNRESQARQAIYMRKFELELQNWLREIRDEAFVEFKGEYADMNPESEEANPS